MNIGPDLPAWISQTWNECILKLRPVAFSARWTVGAALVFLLLYGLIALIFPEAVEKSARQFSERGIASLFVGILALPCAAIFLLIVLMTFVFAPLVPLLMAPLFFGAMIGKAGLLRRMGVGLLKPVAADVSAPVSVLAGGLALALVYTIPVVGLFAWALTWTWAFGAFVQSVFRRNRPVTDSVPPHAAPGASGPQKPTPPGTSPSPLPSQPLPSASASGITLATATELAGPTGSESLGAVASVHSPAPVIAPSATTTSSITPQAGESGNLVVSSSGPSVSISGTPVSTPISSELALSVVPATDPLPRLDGPTPDSLGGSANPGPAPDVSAAGFTPPPPSPSPSSSTKSPSTATFASTGGTASIPGVRPPELSPSELLHLPRVALVPRLAPLAFDWIILSLMIHGPIFDFDRFQWICRLIEFSYFAGFYYWRGATPMGLIFGLRVVRLDGRPLDFPTLAVRGVAAAFGAMAAGIGYFWCAWDPEKQSWHDKLAGTVVVKTSRSSTLV